LHRCCQVELLAHELQSPQSQAAQSDLILQLGKQKTERREWLNAIQKRLTALRTRMDRMYEDKLDGRIDEEFWSRKMTEWRSQERTLQGAADSLTTPLAENHVLTAQRTLELANKAHFLYVTRNRAE
jgi:site-specific DNA recombinase